MQATMKPIKFMKPHSEGQYNFDKWFQIQSVTLTITTACNIRCNYCFETHEPRLLKPAQAIEVLDRVWKNYEANSSAHKPEKLALSIFGGEPLLAFKSIKAMIEHADAKGYRLAPGITTNLTLLTDEMIEFFDEHQIYLLVSIDGTKEVHDKHRDGTFDVVSGNLKKLVDAGLQHLVEARMTATPEDFDKMVDGVKLIYEMGIDNIAPVPVTDAVWNKEQIKMLQAELDKLYAWVLEIYSQGDTRRNLSVKMVDDYLYHCLANTHDLKLTPCVMGSNRWISIGPDGEIFPCHQIHTRKEQRSEFYIGNILTDEIFPGRILGQVQPHQWKKDKDPKYTCDTCSAFNICRGGCPSENFDVTGSMNVPPDEWCEFVRASKATTEKFQQYVLEAPHIRNRQINSLKANLQMKQQVEETINMDVNDPLYSLRLMHLYEALMGNESVIMPGFREYFMMTAVRARDKLQKAMSANSTPENSNV